MLDEETTSNGLVIVGQATDSNGFWRAFRWTASTGMQDIGTLAGPMSNATAVNMDGTVIVGNSLTTSSSGFRSGNGSRSG